MKRTLALAVLMAVPCHSLLAQGTAPSPTPPANAAPTAPVVPDEKTLYALGVSVAKGLSGFSLSPAEAASVLKGVADGLGDKATGLDLDAARPKIMELAQSRTAATLEKQKAKGQAFRDEAAKASGAVVLPSGLIYKETQAGTGESPAATDSVKVNYRGTLTDGTEFDNSAKHGEPAKFALNHVIPCWTEGIQKMKTAGKARLVCPAEIAYGERPRPNIPPGSTLVFDVELLEVVKGSVPSGPPGAPPAPKAAAPSPLPHR
jgi:FKBP-type peptidyl-prolyl cis-trans isomerase FkpA